MELDKLSTASSVAVARRPLLQALVIERRILFACTVLVGLCSFLWITAACTEHWVHIDAAESGIKLSSSRNFYYSRIGLWQTCRFVKNVTNNINSTVSPPPRPADLEMKCTNYLSAALANGTQRDLAYHVDVAQYSRTMVSFAIIGLFVIIMGCGFSSYTFCNPRYMFKRLAAGIHFISASCLIVTVQVMTTTLDFFKQKIRLMYPVGAWHNYSVSYYLALFVVLVHLSSALAFLWYSRKRKGNKAATDELAMADEPTIIGR